MNTLLWVMEALALAMVALFVLSMLFGGGVLAGVLCVSFLAAFGLLMLMRRRRERGALDVEGDDAG